MALSFHKMHGLGNDFVLLDLREQVFDINSAVAVHLADRHTGIGCDQVLVLRESQDADQLAAFEVWNADGSMAEQCGNGVRCMGLYLHNRAETPEGEFRLAGPTGPVTIECLDDNEVRVNMGKPRFLPEQVPVLLNPAGDGFEIELDQHLYRIGAVSMGNPHALMVVDDIETVDVGWLGPAIGSHPAFPQGCNAGFAEVIDRKNIRLRVYERGAAETNACGSGACAAMSILRRSGLVDKTVNVTQAGGVLIISWYGGNNPVMMTGSANHIFDGVLNER